MKSVDEGPAAVDFGAMLASSSEPGKQALVAGVQQGDVDAFRALYDHFAANLLDFAFSYVCAREDAEDIVHDLFLWIWEHRHEWDPVGSLRPYLFKSVRNRALNRLAQRQVQERFAQRMGHDTVPAGAGPAPPNDPAVLTTTRELNTVLADAIARLPPRCREVFLLVREQELSYAKVAELLKITPKTVEIHMNHALGALRRRLAEWRA